MYVTKGTTPQLPVCCEQKQLGLHSHLHPSSFPPPKALSSQTPWCYEDVVSNSIDELRTKGCDHIQVVSTWECFFYLFFFILSSWFIIISISENVSNNSKYKVQLPLYVSSSCWKNRSEQQFTAAAWGTDVFLNLQIKDFSHSQGKQKNHEATNVGKYPQAMTAKIRTWKLCWWDSSQISTSHIKYLTNHSSSRQHSYTCQLALFLNCVLESDHRAPCVFTDVRKWVFCYMRVLEVAGCMCQVEMCGCGVIFSWLLLFGQFRLFIITLILFPRRC